MEKYPKKISPDFYIGFFPREGIPKNELLGTALCIHMIRIWYTYVPVEYGWDTFRSVSFSLPAFPQKVLIYHC